MPLGYIPGSHSGRWSTLSHRLFGSRKFSRTIEFRIICGWLPDHKVQVLDVGAGVGELSQQLSLLGHCVTALDYDPDALREANSPGVPPLRLVSGDAHRLPFPALSFDLVVCNSALEHFAHDEQALGEMARVLRPNGRLILTTDSFPGRITPWLHLIPRSWRRGEMKCPPAELSAAMRTFHQREHGVVNYYSLEVLQQKLHRHGLVIQDAQRYLNGMVSKAIFESHLLLRGLTFYNGLSRRLFPLFFPFTFPGRRQAEGYGLAVCACKTSQG